VISFNRLAYIDRLTRAGISKEHARAHLEALEEVLQATSVREKLARIDQALADHDRGWPKYEPVTALIVGVAAGVGMFLAGAAFARAFL
jgi:hypothetical protein